MSVHPNPMGREYTPEEWQAARRIGLTTTQTVWNGSKPETIPGGPLIYGTGPGWPDEIERRLRKTRLDVVALEKLSGAMQREWKKQP